MGHQGAVWLERPTRDKEERPDLLYAALTKTCGTFVHGRNATVDWRIVARLATGSIPATIATILLLRYLDLGGHGSGRRPRHLH